MFCLFLFDFNTLTGQHVSSKKDLFFYNLIIIEPVSAVALPFLKLNLNTRTWRSSLSSTDFFWPFIYRKHITHIQLLLCCCGRIGGLKKKERDKSGRVKHTQNTWQEWSWLDRRRRHITSSAADWFLKDCCDDVGFFARAAPGMFDRLNRTLWKGNSAPFQI